MTKRNEPKGQGKLFSSTGFGKVDISYHSGPNPELSSFVKKHAKPYDLDTDDYHRDSFNPQIRVSKADPIYNMHTYWSKKHYKAIMQYIEHFTEPGDLVLDQFCGSGMTGVAALATGRVPILTDLSPAATFITKNYCDPVDPEQLQSEFDRVMKKVKPELDWLYETRCDRCRGRATTGYVVWSERFQCDRCLRVVPLYDCPKVEVPKKSGDGYKTVRVCPHCLSDGIRNPIDIKNHKHGRMPVEVSYLCLDGCSPKRDSRTHRDPKKSKRDFFEKYDLRKLEEIEKEKIPYWYPTAKFPRGLKTTEFFNKGMPNVSDIFTKRNLWALSAFRDKADKNLGVLFSSNLFQATVLQQYRKAGGGFQKGTYYVPPLSMERNQYDCISRKLSDLKRGYSKLSNIYGGIGTWSACISTQDARSLKGIPANSVDYVFTDPSYGDAVQYGELNFVWEAWLGFDTSWITDEIIVNPTRGLSDEDWAEGMHAAMEEAFRVLKPGRWASICFHATSLGVWHMLQDVMADVGFVFDKSELPAYIDPEQKSYNQLVADKVVKP